MSSNDKDASDEEAPPIESLNVDEHLSDFSEISVRGLSARVAERRAGSTERLEHLENESERTMEGNTRGRSNQSVGERSEMSSRIDLFEMKDYREYATSIGLQSGLNSDDTEGKRYFEQRQQFHEIDQTVNLMDSAHKEPISRVQSMGSKDSSIAPPTDKVGSIGELRNKFRDHPRSLMAQQRQQGSFLNVFHNLDLEEVFLGESRAGSFKRHSGDISVTKKTTKGEKNKMVVLLMKALFWIFVLALLMVALVCVSLYGSDLMDALMRESSDQRQEAPPKKATNLRFESSTESRFCEVFDFISQQGISSPDDLLDESSIQYHALRWLADTDPRTQFHLDHHLVARYVLAVVAYATHESIAEAHSVGDVTELPAYENAAFGFDRWMTGATVCKWEGITCHEQGRLKKVEMSHGNLPGTIPSELFAVDIEYLDLSHNQLGGSFPNFLVGQTSDLRSLQLEHNSLEGSVPASVCSLRSLNSLSVDCDEVACECCDNC